MRVVQARGETKSRRWAGGVLKALETTTNGALDVGVRGSDGGLSDANSGLEGGEVLSDVDGRSSSGSDRGSKRSGHGGGSVLGLGNGELELSVDPGGLDVGEVLDEEVGLLSLERLSGVGRAGGDNDVAGSLSGSDTGGGVLEADGLVALDLVSGRSELVRICEGRSQNEQHKRRKR